MLLKTHIRICNRILDELKVPLSCKDASRLKNGVVEPDKQRTQYESHHYGRSYDIEKYIVAARRSFLQNDYRNAYFYLGFALHYIQDAYTSVPIYKSYNNQRHPNNRIWHQNYEQGIDEAPFVSDVERMIQHVFHDDYSQLSKYSALARRLSENVEGRDVTLRAATLVGDMPSEKCGKPVIDLNIALKASYVVSKSVLGPTNCPQLEAILMAKLKEYERLLQSREFSLSTEIAGLARQRDFLKGKIVQGSGFVRMVKNWFYGVRVKSCIRRIDDKILDYNSQGHLQRVAGEYKRTANLLKSRYEDWYTVSIPVINFGIVKKEILTIGEVSTHLGFDADSIRSLLSNDDHSCFFVGNRELVLRSELNRALNRLSPNGIREYK